MVGSEPRSNSLETESAGHPSAIGENPLGQAKKRKNAASQSSRRRALTGVAASFAVPKGAPRAKPSSEALSVFVLTERLGRSGVTNSESFSVAANESDALRKG